MKKLNNSNLYQLLHIVKFEGNLKKLTRNNISYLEIVNNIKLLVEENKLEHKEDKLTLTADGEALIKELSHKYKIKNKEEWIDKEFKSKIEKLDIDFVFLPNQNDLHF